MCRRVELGGVPEWPQIAACNPIRQREGVAAEHVDVIIPERGEASDILVAHLEALFAQLPQAAPVLGDL